LNWLRGLEATGLGKSTGLGQWSTGRSLGVEHLNATLKRLVAGQALFVLAQKGDADEIRRAISLGAKGNILDVPDDRGICPLAYVASLHGISHPAARALIDGGADAQALHATQFALDAFKSNEPRTMSASEETKKLPENNVEDLTEQRRVSKEIADAAETLQENGALDQKQDTEIKEDKPTGLPVHRH